MLGDHRKSRTAGYARPAWLGASALIAFALSAANAYRASGSQLTPQGTQATAGKVPAPPAGVSNPLPFFDLKGYVAELDRWSAAASRLKLHPEEATDLAKNLPATWPVTVDGQHYSVSTAWLGDSLASLHSKPWLADRYTREMKMRLETLRAQASALSEADAAKAGPDPVAARQRLDQVLGRYEFRGLRGPGWLDGVHERIGIWLGELERRVASRLGGHPRAFRGSMWAIAIIAAAGFMAWLMRSFLRRPIGAALELKGPIRVVRGSRDWAHEALEASRGGNYRDAIRLAYWAGVYRLAELGFWHVDRTRTHREYLRLLPEALDAGKRRSALAEVTTRFERVWYGKQAASRDDFQFVITQLEMLGCTFPSTLATGSS
jgi:hypothetical protein